MRVMTPRGVAFVGLAAFTLVSAGVTAASATETATQSDRVGEVQPLDSSNHINVTPENMASVMETSNTKLVIFEFTGKNCASCPAYTKAWQGVVEQDKGDVLLGVVDVDVNPGINSKYPYKTLAEAVGIFKGQVVDGPHLLRTKAEMRNWTNDMLIKTGKTPRNPDEVVKDPWGRPKPPDGKPGGNKPPGGGPAPTAAPTATTPAPGRPTAWPSKP